MKFELRSELILFQAAELTHVLNRLPFRKFLAGE